MITTPFLTDLDSRAVVKGSRDPLGIQQIWTRLGRHVVGNLTTVSDSVRDAYGWQNLKLGQDFYEVETLPESDRVRYSISPTARKEVLRRLLALNHDRAKAEQAVVHVADAAKQAPKKRKSSKNSQATSPGLYADDGGGSV